MSTDRELLERAARAASYSETKINERGWFYVCTYPGDPKEWELWNPLEDDGDAFRLAVKLKITPHIDSNMTDCEGCTEAHFGDPYAATRRAIVRAAAAMAGDAP